MLSAMVALLGLAGPCALAQTIPDAIRTKVGELGPEEVQVVRQYVGDNSKNLLTTPPNPQLLRKDREALLDPLSRSGTSVPFRIAYDREINPVATQMAASGDKMIVINGLILAGELATDKGVNLIESKIGDKDPSVRFQAAYALARTFFYAQEVPSAVGPATLMGAVKDLEQRIAQEKDPNVLDRLIRAGIGATAVQSLMGDAISAVAKGTIQAAKGGENPGNGNDCGALLRAAVGLRDTLAQAGLRGLPVPAQSAKDAAEMAGALIARAVRMVDQKQLPLGNNPLHPMRDTCAQVASAAQTVSQLAGEVLQPGGDFKLRKNGTPFTIGDSLRQGTVQGDATFTNDAGLLIGAGEGMLSKAPFNIPPERFK
jgi:hypothetical protein